MSTPPQGQILLSEWAGDSRVPRLLGAGFDRSPCPICGHPTMDCTHDPHTEGALLMAEKTTAAKKAAAPQAEPAEATAGVGDDAVVVTADEKIEGVYETGGGDEYVTLTKDVVEEFFYPGTKRPATRILFSKGQVVKKSAIDALNARVEHNRAVAESEEK